MGRRRRRGKRRGIKRLLDPAGIFSKRKKRRSNVAKQTKQAVQQKKATIQTAQAQNVAAQQQQQQQQQQQPGITGHGIQPVASRKPTQHDKRVQTVQKTFGRGKGAGRQLPTQGSPRPGRGRGKGGRPIAQSDRTMDGGGYRNRAFGMGREQRGFGMRGNAMPDFMAGRNRGFGMNRGDRGMGMGREDMRMARGFGNIMQSDTRSGGRIPTQSDTRSGKHTRPIRDVRVGRPNPYADQGGSVAQQAGGILSAAIGQGGSQNPRIQQMQQQEQRRLTNASVAPSSSYNPSTGKMDYAQRPASRPRRGRGRGKGGGALNQMAQSGFRGRRSRAFPNADVVASAVNLSDIRMKENIERTGTSPSGIPIYEFNYLGDNNRYNGAIAQDLLAMGRKDVVHKDEESGYYKIDYSKIDVTMALKN